MRGVDRICREDDARSGVTVGITAALLASHAAFTPSTHVSVAMRRHGLITAWTVPSSSPPLRRYARLIAPSPDALHLPAIFAPLSHRSSIDAMIDTMRARRRRRGTAPPPARSRPLPAIFGTIFGCSRIRFRWATPLS